MAEAGHRPGAGTGNRPLRDGDVRSVLAAPAAEAAPRLLGAWFRHGEVVVRITEVEAYGGGDDPASHAYRGRTPRNAAMFARSGTLYCYLVYGVHHCCNVVTGAAGEAGAVLLRSGEVVAGESVARARRDGAGGRDLVRGPGRLSQAMGLDRGHDGTDLLDTIGDPGLVLGPGVADHDISRGPRVGVRHAADTLNRFWVSGDHSVSDYRPARSRGR